MRFEQKQRADENRGRKWPIRRMDELGCSFLFECRIGSVERVQSSVKLQLLVIWLRHAIVRKKRRNHFAPKHSEMLSHIRGNIAVTIRNPHPAAIHKTNESTSAPD